MSDKVYKFCGNCYCFDVDKEHPIIGVCVKSKRHISIFAVCKDHKFG